MNPLWKAVLDIGVSGHYGSSVERQKELHPRMLPLAQSMCRLCQTSHGCPRTTEMSGESIM